MTAFFDTNILIYGLVPPLDDGSDAARKRLVASMLIDTCVDADELIISTQVLGEFFTVATRKGPKPLTAGAAALILEQLNQLEVISVDSELVMRAAGRVLSNRLSYWDALIVEAAIRARAGILYTEDLQNGMRFDTLEVRNPFAS